jgi:hypothetical protein
VGENYVDEKLVAKFSLGEEWSFFWMKLHKWKVCVAEKSVGESFAGDKSRGENCFSKVHVGLECEGRCEKWDFWRADCGVWSVQCGVWCLRLECEDRSVMWDVWLERCGVWRKEWEVRSVKCGLWREECEWVKCPRVRCLCVKRVQVKKCKQKMVWSKHVGKIIWLKIKKNIPSKEV